MWIRIFDVLVPLLISVELFLVYVVLDPYKFTLLKIIFQLLSMVSLSEVKYIIQETKNKITSCII